MSKKHKIIIVLAAVLLISGISYLFQQHSSSQKKINNLNSQVDNLENELNTAQERISELEDENSELEEKLSNVEHFDDNGTIGRGYTQSGTNYTGQVIETNIDGEFEGWEGETIFKMMNGSIWQQSSYAYTYHYAYMPDVIIYRKGGSYYMKVEGVDDEIQVRQLR
jgi:outer membrane murein-binding lipoprotein Lpp